MNETTIQNSTSNRTLYNLVNIKTHVLILSGRTVKEFN